MIIKPTENNYEKVAQQRYEDEERLIDSILKQCTENNSCEVCYLEKNEERYSFIHHKIPSGLHVYTWKIETERDADDSWKSPYRDYREKFTKDHIVYSIIVPCEEDPEEINEYMNDGINPRIAITCCQPAIIYENMSDCSKIKYEINQEIFPNLGHVGNFIVEIIKSNKETMSNYRFYQNTEYLDESPSSYGINGIVDSRDINSEHKTMSDVVKATIESIPYKDMYKKYHRDSFKRIDDMLKIEREKMKSNNDEKLSAMEEVMQGLRRLGYTEAAIENLYLQLKKEILESNNTKGKDSDEIKGKEERL